MAPSAGVTLQVNCIALLINPVIQIYFLAIYQIILTRFLSDKELNVQEVIDCIRGLKENKSPGCDGLTGEFYKNFSDILAPFLLAVFKESIDLGELPASLKQGVIVLKIGDQSPY